MENPSSKRQIKCPQCGLLTFYSTDNPFRPFCSERCKILDLGAWASEKYAVPTPEHADFVHPDSDSDEDSEPEA